MNKKLWEASNRQKKKSLLSSYEQFISKIYKKNFNQKYESILKWSIKNPGDFWSSIWDFSEVKGFKSKIKIKKSKIFYKNKFLPNSKLNFAENLLSKNNKDKAITFISENGFREERNWHELNLNVSKISKFLKSIHIKKKDRVVAYMPNTIETVVAFIASSSLGAIWSSCSPDFGVKGVVERFSQINPKVLFVVDKYFYNGKIINTLERIPLILKEIPSIKYVVIVNYPGEKYLNNKYSYKKVKVLKWNELMKQESEKIQFSKFDFEQDLAILYSSGTTGKPKCICHRSGGVLLQHKKEHQLHCDIREGDNVFYFTTCGWMMWNWLVSVLASKASIVLFDGSPMYKKNDLLLKIAEKEKITLFGISAKYVDALRKSKPTLKYKYKLTKLRTICSTGSPLSNDGFKYIYENIKKNVHLSSISGGTDIVSCFVLGNLYQPVILGEIQNKGLGMNVDVFNEKGKSLKNKKGELVCKNPFPSMPLKFWNDKNDIKFKKAYFNNFLNTWYHGDYAEIKKDGGFIIHGRSDTTLNPGGVRLGTAEIYSEVEKFIEIKESIVVGQAWDNDVRIILFIVLNPKHMVNEDLLKKIRTQIRKNASPRHVPSKIIVVDDIPRTKNGKIVELAVKNTIEGNEIKNKEALANPRVLDQYKNLKELFIQ
ncbi:acetoacetate--CoA ligase [Candidatus Pelagibacter bacterium]|nr:acetoacetate--CoA ligase [Candidatus Pelagibacter bacterium]MDA8835451.1 acetoacetate--CoA ligase [Candidatus Pelagibacter bacterium]